eukprot:16447812-Heterocapsa_arctica.AAC.1
MEQNAERHCSVELRSRTSGFGCRSSGRKTGRKHPEGDEAATDSNRQHKCCQQHETSRSWGMRHMDIRELWLQDEIRNGMLKIERIAGLQNTADVLTKAMPGAPVMELITKLSLEIVA